jgi:hypothetical protein
MGPLGDATRFNHRLNAKLREMRYGKQMRYGKAENDASPKCACKLKSVRITIGQETAAEVQDAVPGRRKASADPLGFCKVNVGNSSKEVAAR